MRSIYALLFVVAFVPDALAQSNADLVGVWSVDFPGTIQNMSANERSAYDSLSDRARTNFRNTFSSRTFEFRNDFGITISFSTTGGAKSAAGSWRYNARKKLLSIEAGGTDRDFVVQWSDANSISLKYQSTDKGSLLQSLCLDRQ